MRERLSTLRRRRPWVRRLLVTVILVSLSVAALFKVKLLLLIPNYSRGMEPTVFVGDEVILLMRAPKVVQRGDLVVAVPPRFVGLAVLKRVVATAGDEVRVASGKILVNGEQLRPPDLDYSTLPGRPPSRLPPRDVGTLVLRAGELYLLGDNHRESTDSRSFGPVPVTSVIGRPVLVLPESGYVRLPRWLSQQASRRAQRLPLECRQQ